jgi:hypothetical protein
MQYGLLKTFFKRKSVTGTWEGEYVWFREKKQNYPIHRLYHLLAVIPTVLYILRSPYHADIQTIISGDKNFFSCHPRNETLGGEGSLAWLFTNVGQNDKRQRGLSSWLGKEVDSGKGLTSTLA